MKHYFYKIDQRYGDSEGIFWCSYNQPIEELRRKGWFYRYKYFKVLRRFD